MIVFFFACYQTRTQIEQQCKRSLQDKQIAAKHRGHWRDIQKHPDRWMIM